MQIIGSLYHWSPSDRRESILKEGLQILTTPTFSTQKYPYVCLGTSPSAAWGLSGGYDPTCEILDWDLYQVTLEETDEVHILPLFGYKVQEVRVRNPIPPQRVWYVGSREHVAK